MIDPAPKPPRKNFRRFFFRGLAILLPTVLTIWILIAAYNFVDLRIAQPINRGVRQLVLESTPWPRVTEADLTSHELQLERDNPSLLNNWRRSPHYRQLLETDARRLALEAWWRKYWMPLDLIGLLIAIILIYMAGALTGSFIGRRLHQRGEMLLQRVPLIKKVYPFVKQITDFVVGQEDQPIRFSRVVAVEYPRKGLYSVGLVTGGTMRAIQEHAGRPCMTIFVPSSPTPFTGYVITVPEEDTISLPVSIEDAIRFTVSGGVIIPPQQLIEQARSSRAPWNDAGVAAMGDLPQP